MESIFNHLIKEREPYYEHTLEGWDDMPAHAKSTIIGAVSYTHLDVYKRQDIFVSGVGNVVYFINTFCIKAFRNQARYAYSHVGMGTSFRIVRTGESRTGCLDVCTVQDLSLIHI